VETGGKFKTRLLASGFDHLGFVETEEGEVSIGISKDHRTADVFTIYIGDERINSGVVSSGSNLDFLMGNIGTISTIREEFYTKSVGGINVYRINKAVNEYFIDNDGTDGIKPFIFRHGEEEYGGYLQSFRGGIFYEYRKGTRYEIWLGQLVQMNNPEFACDHVGISKGKLIVSVTMWEIGDYSYGGESQGYLSLDSQGNAEWINKEEIHVDSNKNYATSRKINWIK
jgi:hypothetical protein